MSENVTTTEQRTTTERVGADELDYDPAIGRPGDVTTEPVATAAQSARPGSNRVGPPTIAQDATAEHYAPDGVTQFEPGVEAPADLPMIGGVIELPEVFDEYGHDVSEHKSSSVKMAERKPENDAK